MDKVQMASMGAILALAGSLGVGIASGASQSQSGSGDNKPSEFGRAGNQGEGFGKQDTIKGKGQNPESTIKQDAQITLGGARPVVEGQILNVQGDDYVIRDSSGSEVRLRVNKDTNMDCAGSGAQTASMSTGRQADDQAEIPPTSHMQEQMSQQSRQSGDRSGSQEQKGQEIVRESKSHESGSSSHQQSGERIGDQSGTQSRSSLGKESGGDIARGSGFTVGPKGKCQFKTGDRVHAEVSDLGTVLFIKQISDRDTQSQQAMSGQMLPEGSTIMPGERASAQQRAQLMKPGAVPAPLDEQNPELITREGKQTAKTDINKNSCEGCKVVRGLVLKSEPHSMTVRDSSQKEIRLKIDQDKLHMGSLSNPRAGTFVEGDRVEAMMTPDGYAWSITALKQQQGQPGILGAPGD